MDQRVLVAIAGIVISVLTYFAGVYRTERRYKKQDKSARTSEVFNRYMELRKGNKTGGYDGLLKSGVATLASDSEIREVADRIVNHGEKSPINGLVNVDLKVFFSYAASEGVNFLRSPVEEIIEKSRAVKK